MGFPTRMYARLQQNSLTESSLDLFDFFSLQANLSMGIKYIPTDSNIGEVGQKNHIRADNVPIAVMGSNPGYDLHKMQLPKLDQVYLISVLVTPIALCGMYLKVLSTFSGSL